MRKRFTKSLLACILAAVAIGATAASYATSDPLPSWKDGETKSAIVDFVAQVTDKSSPGYVPPAERIATFDNDGTLWAEQPLYFQALYAFDYVKSVAKDHPEWKDTEPYKSLLAGDMKTVMASGMDGLMKLLAVSHVNVTDLEFDASVREWLAKTKHPTTSLLFTQMTYQPMVELLDYLRANDFKTFIVSGGGIDFIRVFSEVAYGIPPEQVIGSTLDAKFEMRDGVPTIVKQGKLMLNDDKDGKPVGIYRHIGRRPIFAAGNSDGDMQMLQYTTIAHDQADTRPRFGLLVHHTDAEREFAYDRKSHIGQLDKALDEATKQGWRLVDMQSDWSRIYTGSKQ